MPRNSFAIAIAFFQHWLRKEDLYSQQSPYIFSRYQDLIAYLKSPKLSHSRATDFSTSIFSNAARKRTTSAENLATRDLWKPRKKAALLCSYFCQTTAAKQVIELGTGTGAVTRLLDQVTKGHLYTFSEGDSFDSKDTLSSNTRVIPEFTVAKFKAVLQDLDALDFLVIHPEFSQTRFREIFSICLPRMQSTGILALGGIHQSEEMNACWQEVRKEGSVRLTLDFFDYGFLFFDYSGPKTDLILEYK
jgi:predicted O-methyltransferase YrrM